MAESDLLKNAVVRQHEKHHETIAPKTRRNDSTSKRTHKDDKQVHHQEKQSKGRKTAMKNKLTQTLTALAFSMTLALGLASGNTLKGADFNPNTLLADNNKLNNIQLIDNKLTDENKLDENKIDENKLAENKLADFQRVENKGNDCALYDDTLSGVRLDGGDLVDLPLLDDGCSCSDLLGANPGGLKDVNRNPDLLKDGGLKA
jgi:hypothetical protein